MVVIPEARVRGAVEDVPILDVDTVPELVRVKGDCGGLSERNTKGLQLSASIVSVIKPAEPVAKFRQLEKEDIVPPKKYYAVPYIVILPYEI